MYHESILKFLDLARLAQILGIFQMDRTNETFGQKNMNSISWRLISKGKRNFDIIFRRKYKFHTMFKIY